MRLSFRERGGAEQACAAAAAAQLPALSFPRLAASLSSPSSLFASSLLSLLSPFIHFVSVCLLSFLLSATTLQQQCITLSPY